MIRRRNLQSGCTGLLARRLGLKRGLLDRGRLLAPEIERNLRAQIQHVVVAKSGAGFLVRVADGEVRPVPLMRKLQCFRAARFHRTIRSEFWGAGVAKLRKLRRIEIQMGRFHPADVDIRRVGIAPEHLLELELCLVLLLMVHRLLLQNLGGLKLRLDQVLLQTLSQAIPGFYDLLDLSELLLIAIENRHRLRVIEQLEVELLDLFLDRTLRSFIAVLGVVGVFFGLGFLQTKLARTRDVLRDTEAGVIKVAALVTREGLRTADGEMLEQIGRRRA